MTANNIDQTIVRIFDSYKELYGIDVSYMKFKIDSQPVYTNGEPCYEYQPDECGGDWTKLGFIRLNPDMKSVMDKYGVERHYSASIDDFAKAIIAHELAHEVWNNIAPESFKLEILDQAKNSSFTTVYLKTVKPNKLDEETFCEYLASQIVQYSNESITFKSIPKSKILSLLNEIDGYIENDRYKRSQFEKYLSSIKKIDISGNSMFYGCFNNAGKCMALAYLNKTPANFILLAEIQSMVKGYGKILINKILSLRPTNIWWCADPINGGKSLEDYYRQFKMKEFHFSMSRWTNTPEFVFYRAKSENDENFLISFLKKNELDRTDAKDMRISAFELTEI